MKKDKNTSDILQIDLLKGIAIILVILGHIVAYQTISSNPQVLSPEFEQNTNLQISQLNNNYSNLITFDILFKPFTHWITFSALFTQQTVPLFLIIMSFNLCLAGYRRGYSELKDYYSKNEISRKMRRYFVPFFITFCFILFVGAVISLSAQKQILYLNYRLLLGYVPIDGPGNYFISLMIQAVVFFPLLYIFFKFNRILCTISIFGLAFIWEFCNNFGINGIWYSDSIIRFFPHMILGIWIAGLYLENQLKNKYFLFFGLLSGLYLIFISQFESGILWGIHFIPYTASQNLFGSGWVALVLILGLLYLPKMKNTMTRPFALLGKATYHIYLLQIVYFGMFPGFGLQYHSIIDLVSLNNFVTIITILFIIILCGVGFYILDKNNFYLKKK